jgi:TolB-like protein/Tfp pilus assembly protein PilF
MTERHTFISGTLAELKRRRVPRTVAGYAVVVFVLLQLMDAAVEPLRLPDWLPTLVVIILILGFPLVFFLAWQFDITPAGVRRTKTDSVLSPVQNTGLFGITLLATLGLGYIFYVYYSNVFEVLEPVAEPIAAEVRQFTAPENSIAVLPFADLSAAGDQAYFSDGIAEEILNLLAQVKDLHVAARTSSFALRDPELDIREIGRLLNVSTVLEGSIRSSGNRIRLTAQLINVKDGYHIWSQSYDREMDDLFAIQDEVASSIAWALVESFTGLKQTSTAKTNSLAAANAYRTGRLHWWRRTPAELQRALVFFAEALEHDAAFAPAYAAMADTWLLLSQYGNITPLKATEKAQPMIEKALEIDPGSAEAFAALGLARWQIGQTDSAESAFLRAVKLNEDYIPAQLWLAGVLGEQGRYPEENRVLKRAMELDPLNELLVVNYATNLRIRGDIEGSRQLLREQIALRPDSTTLLRPLAFVELNSGALVESWKLANRSYLLEPENPADIIVLAKTWMVLEQNQEAEQLLTQGLETASDNFNLLSVYWMSLLVTGRLEEAERLTRELMQQVGDNLPQALARAFNVQLGMLALARDDLAAADRHLTLAMGDGEPMGYDTDQMLVITFAAMVSQRLGNQTQAEERLVDAERQVKRARLNGVDDPGLYYTESSIMALRNNVPAAIERLSEAYDRGFREHWLLELDWRLDAIRDTEAFIALKARIKDDIDQAVLEIRALNLAAL